MKTLFRIFVFGLCSALGVSLTAQSSPIENRASGSSGTHELELSSGTVVLNRVGGPTTDAIFEMEPSNVPQYGRERVVTLLLAPRFQPGDLGIESAVISVGEGVANLELAHTFADRDTLEAESNDPGGYSKSIQGNQIHVDFSENWLIAGTTLGFQMVVDVIGDPGDVPIEVELFAGAKSIRARSGNADGDDEDGNPTSITILPGVDPTASLFYATPSIVLADGSERSLLTAVLLGPDGNPFSDKEVRFTTSRSDLDQIEQPTLLTDGEGRATGWIQSTEIGTSELTAVDVTDGIELAARPTVVFTQGVLLRVDKSCETDRAVPGDIVSYRVEIRNVSSRPAEQIRILDHTPPGFRYLAGSAQLDGQPIPDPALARRLEFSVGEIEGRSIAGGFEPRILTYALVAGSNVRPGTYDNTAVAVDACSECEVSNRSTASIDVVPDAFFENSLVIGKVFRDFDSDGVQSSGEPGIEGVRVVLDDGSYSLTDSHGRYHLRDVEAGQRLVKLDTAVLGDGIRIVGGATRTLTVSPGLLARANFAAVDEREIRSIGSPALFGLEFRTQVLPRPVNVSGYVSHPGIFVGGAEISMPDFWLEPGGAPQAILVGGEPAYLDLPFRIRFEPIRPSSIASWRLQIRDATTGDLLGQRDETGAPPEQARIEVRSHEIPTSHLEHRLEITYTNGIRQATPWGSVGVRILPSGHTLSSAEDSSQPVTSVLIDGSATTYDSAGRFSTDWSGSGSMAFALLTAGGSEVEGSVPMPQLRRVGGSAERLGYDDPDLIAAAGDGSAPVLQRILEFQTQPGGRVLWNGEWLEPDREGKVTVPVEVTTDEEPVSVLVESPLGIRRIFDVSLTLSEFGSNGEPVVLIPAVPHLEVAWPGSDWLGSPVQTLVGRTDPGNEVTINGDAVRVRSDGRFQHELTLPVGESVLRAEVRNPQGDSGLIEEPVSVSGTRFFLVALADGVVGHLRGTGSLEHAGLEDTDETYTDGRLAYYLEGTISGQVMVRSAFDSGRREWDSLFEDLGAYDEARLMTYLDPDASYPVFGDQSQEGRAADTPGKFYLAVESKVAEFLYGSFETGTTGPELATYRRTLHGARAQIRTPVAPELQTQVEVFYAEDDRAHFETEFQATGGSLFYLPHSDVVEGSEQVTLVVRHSHTDLPLLELPVDRDVHYRVSYELGRLWFQAPLPSKTESHSLLDADILPGHPVFVRVSYDTVDPDGDGDVQGARLVQDLGRFLRVGATFVDETQGTRKTELRGVDLDLRTRIARFRAEFAEATGTDSLRFFSDDGGLTFGVRSASSTKRNAWKVSGEVDIAEALDLGHTLKTTAYARRVESGFRTTGALEEYGREQFGFAVVGGNKTLGHLELRTDISTGLDTNVTRDRNLYSARWSWALYKKAQIDFEYLGERTETLTIPDFDEVALRIRSELRQGWVASLGREGRLAGPERDRTTFGLDAKIAFGVQLGGQFTTGSDGESALARARLDRGEKQYYLESRSDWADRNRDQTLSWGARQELGENTSVYTEYRWTEREGVAEDGSTFGAEQGLQVWGAEQEWKPADGLAVRIQAEHSRTTSSAGAVRERSVVGSTLDLSRNELLEARLRGEVRVDEGASETTQYLTDNRVRLDLDPDWSLLGRSRWSRTTDRRTDKETASHSEHSVGFAYRPVTDDRWNALGLYTHSRDDRPGSSRLDDRTRDLVSLEAIYDLNPKTEVVGRFGARWQTANPTPQTEVRTFTHLSAGRVNLSIYGPFGLGTEYRVFVQREAEDQRRGWLNELTWDATPHLRLGLGYDFTDFEDDLNTDNDYTTRDWFLRIQGRY